MEKENQAVEETLVREKDSQVNKKEIKKELKKERKIEKKNEKQKKKKSKKKGRRHIRWDRLDNTAHLFPVIAGESMTNTYRISVELDEPIVGKLLQEALDIVLPKFDLFNVRMRKGFFWYYFEENGKRAPRVKEETTYPCQYIEPNKNHSYLFRVTYYKNRINLEVFHVLTDGMGGVNFLKELTYQYLRLCHPDLREMDGDTLSVETSMNREDSFLNNYRKKAKKPYESKKALLIKGERLPKQEFGVMHGYMDIPQLKTACKKYGLSINEYLVANFVWSIYQVVLRGMPSDKAIRAAVPVNLRPYFDSVTTKNFFVVVSADFLPEKNDYTFEEVAQIVKESLKAQINKDYLEKLFSYNVSNQMNRLARIAPIGLKNIAIRTVYTQSALANTTTVTNIGNITVREEYEPYIKRFQAFLAMSKGQFLKGTICSYQSTLLFTFSSVLKNTAIQRCFFRQLASDGIEVCIETNGVYYE